MAILVDNKLGIMWLLGAVQLPSLFIASLEQHVPDVMLSSKQQAIGNSHLAERSLTCHSAIQNLSGTPDETLVVICNRSLCY